MTLLAAHRDPSIRHLNPEMYNAVGGAAMAWEQQLVSPDQVIRLMRPGMRVFVGTGAAEPRTLVQHLISSHSSKLKDLELIQLASFAETVALDNLQAQKFRLKTFFSGWVAQEAIAAGWVEAAFPKSPD